MATEIFWSPINTPTLLDGEKNGGMLYVFGKLSLRAFQKHMTHTPSMAIEKFQSP
jgi:hypothetical protein